MKIILIVSGIILLSCNPTEVNSYKSSGDKETTVVGISAKEFYQGSIQLINKDGNLFILKKQFNKTEIADSLVADDEMDSYLNDYGFFKFDNKEFIYAQYVYSGTSAETDVTIYKIDTSRLDIIKLQLNYASAYYRSLLTDDQGIWKGEFLNIKDNSISSTFYIYNDTDANCCPSGGKVNAIYKLSSNDGISMFFEQDTCIFIEKTE